MFKLSSLEKKIYDQKIVAVLGGLPPGIYLPSDFFSPSQPTPPRIIRKFREDVAKGVYVNVKLASSGRSRDGYVVT